jgi:hypothetical protein
MTVFTDDALRGCDMDVPTDRLLEFRIMRAFACGGFLFGITFFASSIGRGWFGLSWPIAWRDLVFWVELMGTLGFSLLFASSIGLFGGRAWGRRGFIVALAIIAVVIVASRVHQLAFYLSVRSSSQPDAVPLPVWRIIGSYTTSLIEEVTIPVASICILSQPEFARATQAPSAGGFSVIPLANEG